MHRIIGVTELQRRFRSVFDQVAKENIPYVLTRGSRPEAALISYEDFLRLQALREEGVLARFDRRVAGWRNKMMNLVKNDLPPLADNGLPANAGWLFPEYDFGTMGVESHRSVVVERILERGSWGQLRWLFATYGEAGVAEWVRRHGFRLLSKRSFALWRLALDVEDHVAPEWAIEAKGVEPW
jgi:prevent-host-death family protein